MCEMCEMCDELNYGPAECPRCGKLICFDAKSDGDDIFGRAVVSSAGDVMCVRCLDLEETEQQELEEESAMYFNDYDACCGIG